MFEADMVKIAGYLVKTIEIALRIQKVSGKKLVDFEKQMDTDEEVQTLSEEIKTWARTFGIPGV
jgi:hypothetical protein